MANNYGLILLLGSIITALISLLDIFLLKPARMKNAAEYQRITCLENVKSRDLDKIRKAPFLVDFSRSFFPIIFFILIVRSFFYEPFRIPSGSMKPTLQVGDFILVEKFSYGLRIPGFEQLLFETGHPKVGDVAVFRFPLEPSDNYIKRIVGLPGERITYKNKKIEIASACYPAIGKPSCSGKRMVEQRLSGNSLFNEDGDPVASYQEKLGLNWHQILLNPDISDTMTNNQWYVPDGHYFVLGDNRDNSNDSRYWGFVSEDDLVGKAVVVWLHIDFDNRWINWLPSAISFRNAGHIR